MCQKVRKIQKEESDLSKCLYICSQNYYRLGMKKEYLDFITFCVGSLADAMHKSASEVFHALRSTGVLSDYIIPCYDILHTFSKDYLVEELSEVLKEKGAWI